VHVYVFACACVCVCVHIEILKFRVVEHFSMPFSLSINGCFFLRSAKVLGSMCFFVHVWVRLLQQCVASY